METLPAVRLYGKRGSPQAYAIRDFLQRSDVPFEWIELANHEQARAELGLESVDNLRLPICIFPDGTRMERPTVRQVTEKLGWFRHPSRSEYDVAIYGAGPAGLSASVYGASEGLKTVLVERFAVGGQAGTSRRSRTISAFRKGSAAPSSPSARASKPPSSGPRSSFTALGSAGNSPPARVSSTSTTGRGSSRACQFAPRAWSTDAWDCPARTGCSAPASITARAQAKPSFAATNMSSWWAPATLPRKPRCIFPATPAR